MSDLRKQIRDHYDAQSLPPEKADAILAKGRALAAGEAEQKVTPFPKTKWSARRWLALAASIAILIESGVIWHYTRGADFEKLRPVVVAFFANKPMYPKLSHEPEKLRLWALEHGAPAGFQIPAKLRNLPGKGCTILDVDGKPAFLICFMTVDADGRQDGGMVHLLIARRDDFRHVPKSAAQSLTSAGEWNFITWIKGDVVYTVAAPAEAEKVRLYVRAGFPVHHFSDTHVNGANSEPAIGREKILSLAGILNDGIVGMICFRRKECNDQVGKRWCEIARTGGG